MYQPRHEDGRFGRYPLAARRPLIRNPHREQLRAALAEADFRRRLDDQRARNAQQQEAAR